MNTLRLDKLPSGKNSIIERVEDAKSHDLIAARLRDLGFVSGETVKVVACGPFGGNPIAVLIGSSRFALRRSEAARIIIRTDS
ncbi:hypothetical protein COMNV_01650 [Commensalibacter sp. Nvir]|uniref:FeoA family protein n=1 Tax=Commensalibacter sp. Nvir TaxID=3069817 RepID=UPI002D2AACE3|nr:hypothetical protein COMNV_01650 [Commensalibacter sp. Nvir]